MVGTPEVVCERIEILRSKGINRIFGKFGAAGLEPEKSLRCIEMFATEVMPEFAGEPVGAASYSGRARNRSCVACQELHRAAALGCYCSSSVNRVQ